MTINDDKINKLDSVTTNQDFIKFYCVLIIINKDD